LWVESVILTVTVVTVVSTHMQDLQEVTQEIHYENFRSEKLAESGGTAIRKLRSVAPSNRNVQHREICLSCQQVALCITMVEVLLFSVKILGI